MTVELEIGMTAIRRDGERKGPVGGTRSTAFHQFLVGTLRYGVNGGAISTGREMPTDIIAAGYPWDQLGAQVGDTVRRVWHGHCNNLDDYEFIVTTENPDTFHTDGLYVFVKHAVVPVASEPEIEWGKWVDGFTAFVDTKNNRQNQCINGKWQHRFEKPKPLVVQENTHYISAFGSDYKIKLTKVGNETTVEIISQKDYY